MNKFTKIILQLLIASFLTFIALDIIGGIWYFVIGNTFSFNNVEIIQNLGVIFSIIFIIIIMKKYYNIFSLFKLSTLNLYSKLSFSLLTFIIVFLSFFITLICTYYFKLIDLSINIELFEISSLLYFISKSIFLIIGEEIIYRGFLLNVSINKTNSRIIGIIFSSFIFSIGHFQYTTKLDYLIAFWGSIIMSILYIKYISIYASIFFHLSWNLSYYFFSIDNENPLFNIKYVKLPKEFLELTILVIISSLLGINYLLSPKNKNYGKFNKSRN